MMPKPLVRKKIDMQLLPVEFLYQSKKEICCETDPFMVITDQSGFIERKRVLLNS